VKRLTIATVIALTLGLPAAAQAHVTLQPDEAPAGGYARLDVRVPNEEEAKDTTKVQIQMPAGFAHASYEPAAGWKVDVKKTKLAKPVKTEDGTITEEVAQITWTGDGKTGTIKPGQFQDFGLSVGLPDKKPGTKLTFKALQTYTGGQVVRWIGAPESDKPAPQVTLTAPEAQSGAANVNAADTAAAPAAAATGDDDGPSTGLVVVALVLGAAGLAAGGTALLTSRRHPA
jgi:uncharacterized protein